MYSKLKELQEFLNEMIASEQYTYEEILNVSQKLDFLMVDYLKEQCHEENEQ
ncbi:Spo0E family sporulation regulatory protein-aspartic acid phosphatase [Defluviitalea saccharophila]|uniref:Spo0E family sporulation regulatory protein-aspartic acid phosphatase n=1 Tax=Defluviitalea saccharophila TaxID=879970 RepID=A0ABZ2Y1T7_9FIRM|nr:Spo0E family sporulation regulatory protein-aspartic acid phosphatase [Candidatus Epulonipiscium sp.]